MKAVLVFDMPKTCLHCPCCDGVTCGLVGENVPDEKPDWCPLKELPQKQHGVTDEFLNVVTNPSIRCYQNGLIDGWNACLEEVKKRGIV